MHLGLHRMAPCRGQTASPTRKKIGMAVTTIPRNRAIFDIRATGADGNRLGSVVIPAGPWPAIPGFSP